MIEKERPHETIFIFQRDNGGVFDPLFNSDIILLTAPCIPFGYSTSKQPALDHRDAAHGPCLTTRRGFGPATSEHIMTDPILMLIALFAAHFFFDYAGQGDFMSKAKNRLSPIPTIPWQQVLFGHAFIHGAAVALITGVWWLLVLELVIHFVTDDAKCRGKISYNADQAIHYASKVLWWLIAIGWAA